MKKTWYAIPVITLWAVLTAAAWFMPSREISDTERRPLAQLPAFSSRAFFDGTLMADFESYSLDQFPLRDAFRSVKAAFSLYVLGQQDNNDIYISNGYAARQEYPLQEASLSHALERFRHLYDTYLTDSRIFMAVIPDKNYYLGPESGHLTMDYEALFSAVEQGAPWAEHISLTDTLSAEDFYRTDTHWRQEALLPAADRLCAALDIPAAGSQDYTKTILERPFYGVYYGQAALPMEPDAICLLENELLDRCSVYDYETGKTGAIYDMDKLESRDLYDVYLSGARALLTIENPDASTDKELILFRDSFGSSIAPLLVHGYAKITLVDLRYIQTDLLGQFLDFHGQDVLLLYSSLILNSSSAIR